MLLNYSKVFHTHIHMHTLPPFFPHLHPLTPTVAQTNHPNYQQTKHSAHSNINKCAESNELTISEIPPGMSTRFGLPLLHPEYISHTCFLKNDRAR